MEDEMQMAEGEGSVRSHEVVAVNTELTYYRSIIRT